VNAEISALANENEVIVRDGESRR